MSEKNKPSGSVKLPPRVHALARRIAEREQRTIIATIERALTAYDARPGSSS